MGFIAMSSVQFRGAYRLLLLKGEIRVTNPFKKKKTWRKKAFILLDPKLKSKSWQSLRSLDCGHRLVECVLLQGEDYFDSSFRDSSVMWQGNFVHFMLSIK